MPVLLPQRTLRVPQVPRIPTRAPRPSRPPRALLPESLQPFQSLEWVGQGIVYFTFFYCSTNWFYYHNLRKDVEAFKEEQNEKKDEKNKKDQKD